MKHPITPGDLWKIKRVGQPEPARGGDFVVVPVGEADLETNEIRTRLYRIDLTAGETRALTAAGTDADAPAISPDGTRVAFLRKHGEGDDARKQVHVMRLDGGEPQRLTDFPLGAAAPRWMPEGSALIVPVAVAPPTFTVDGTREAVAARKDEKVKARTTEDRVYRYWDHWLTDGDVFHLYLVDAATGDARDLTPDLRMWLDFDDPAGGFDVSTDGATLAFSADISESPHDRLQWAVFTVPIAGGEPPQRLTANLPAHQRRPRWSPDGAHLVYGIQREHDFYADRVRLVRYDLATGEPDVLTEEWDRSATGWEFTLDGASLVFAAEEDGRSRIFSVPLSGGTPRQITDAPGSWHGPRPAGSLVVCRTESLSHPPEAAVIDATGSTYRAGRFNDDLLETLNLGEVEDVRFPGADGREIQAFVVYPPGFDAGRTWPLVHDIHGGPHGLSGDSFHFRWNPQVFAAPGYVVMTVNFHGSTSWGQDFAASIHGAWGDKPAADVLAATDWILQRGFIDPARMGIAGGSYGGYLVAWLTTVTDRFACAICHAGVTDLLGQWASDITDGRERSMGGLPWDGLDRIVRWSPANHMDDVATPTLVVHGEKDYRVVVTQGLAWYGVLKAKGIDARLVYYPDEGHWILKPHNSLHWYGEFLGWLDRYLGDGARSNAR
jgi:dipeptidyl aminopeptidase/acylaminoacyl peptidase